MRLLESLQNGQVNGNANDLHALIAELEGSIQEKEERIQSLIKSNDDTESQLKEHQEWLTDERSRADSLENELREKEKDIEENLKDIKRLNAAISARDDTIRHLEEKIDLVCAQVSGFQDLEEPIHLKRSELEEREPTDAERELSATLKKLEKAEDQIEHLEELLEEARVQTSHLESRIEMERSRRESGEQVVNGGFAVSDLDVNSISSELVEISKKKYKLEEKIKQMEYDAASSSERISYLEDELRKVGEEIWLAKEKIAHQDGHIGHLSGQLHASHMEVQRLSSELAKKSEWIASGGVVDSEKVKQMREEFEKKENKLREERNVAQWHLGEVKQWWNDAKWRVGELEASNSHRQWLLDQANKRIHELQEEVGHLAEFRDRTKGALDETFLIKKQPHPDRYKWQLAMWTDRSPDDLNYRRVWFEIEARGSNVVLLTSSFLNWECALMCDKCDNDSGKYGVWVDLPPGRYEFQFILDGRWTTTDKCPTIENGYGSINNWIYVD